MTATAGPETPGRYLATVIDQLAALLAQVGPEQLSSPTPCGDFDVAALRDHVLEWSQFFTAAFESAVGIAGPAPVAGPPEAVLRQVSRRITACVDAGVTDLPIRLPGATRPGRAALCMCLSEYVVHGHDLARATGRPWNPPDGAVTAALSFMPTLLSDDFRGPGKNFGRQVGVTDSAPALERLLAFTGRDPDWPA